MKNIFKITFLACFTLIAFSCDEDATEGKFGDNPEAGWVHFVSGDNEALIFKEDLVDDGTSTIMVPVNLALPVNLSDLMVSYTINDVVGDSGDIITGTSSLVFPAGTNDPQMIEITLDLDVLANDIFVENVFDVELTSTNRSSVQTGITPGDNFPVTYRVTLSPPCFTPTIDGTYDVVSTNLQSGAGGGCPDGDGSTSSTVTWTALGDDIYASTDLSFGMFAECWGDTPAVGPLLVVVCNELSVTGSDQYGDSYTYNITSINGPDLTIQWENTYGDGGTSVLTRTDGTDWPDLALAE
jgi:hypothetical protein